MKYKLGFIGAGNMGTAIISGAAGFGADDIYVYDVIYSKAEELHKIYGVHAVKSMDELIDKCDMLVLAVKPIYAEEALKGINVPNKAIISIVAGLDMARLGEYTPVPARFLRIMPNTPLMVLEGMSVFSKPSTFTPDELEFAREIFSSLGSVEEVDERFMSAVVGVSGSGPAYVYMMIEAMADAGVKHGLTRAAAIKMEAQTVLGSAKMVLAIDKHHAKLKDDVCSPGGTTIDAVAVLEQEGLRGAVIKAIDACVKKAEEL